MEETKNGIRRKIALALATLSIFVFLVLMLVFVFILYSTKQNIPDFLQPFLTYHIQLMVVMGFFGVGTGLVMYSLFSETSEKEKKMVKTNLEIIAKFLTPEDREVLDLLREKEGMTTQSEIASLPGMSRLKAHRAVKKLEDRGIIHVEKYGKINMVRLVDELKAS